MKVSLIRAWRVVARELDQANALILFELSFAAACGRRLRYVAEGHVTPRPAGSCYGEAVTSPSTPPRRHA
jgi:hypothetical protein